MTGEIEQRERWLLLQECRATWGPEAARQLAEKLGTLKTNGKVTPHAPAKF